MDSSISNETPAPRSAALLTVPEQTAAIDELIALAHQHIRVFDYDLSQTGWNAATRMDELASFLRGATARRLDIIVHDTRYLESACARMQKLLRMFSDRMTIYRTGAEGKSATDPMIIVDDRHYLHRFHHDQPRAIMGVDQPGEARVLAQRFAEIWAGGEPGINATLLGV